MFKLDNNIQKNSSKNIRINLEKKSIKLYMLDYFINNLKNDSGLFETYKSAIAMTFKDRYCWYKKSNKKKYLTESDINIIANNAAIDFLNMLIY